MKFLIAGFGSIGRRHMRNLLALGEHDIVLYRSRRSTLPADELEGFPVETDLREALAHQPDAVIISNPTALHLDVAIPAAEAGCHLLIEKPVSHSLKKLHDLQSALERGGGQALVAFQFRFHPTLVKAAELLASGEIGKPVSARAHWGEYLPNWHPWEDYRKSYAARPELGGGVVLTLCHPFDYLSWLLGEVDALYAMTGQLGGLELGVEDTADISLHFSRGVFGSIHLDYIQRPPAHWLEIIGTQGMLHWDNCDGCLKIFHAGENDWQCFDPPQSFERNQMFMDEMAHFIRVVRGEELPRCSLDDGIKALRLALAVHESAQTHCEVRF
jgi:predicted dehydrogenase